MYSLIVLTQSQNAVIGPIARLLGNIMDGIYNMFFNTFGVVSIGFSIILFTIITRLLMLPLAVHQQKSTVAMQKIQPELKALQNKYKDKKDAESQKKFQMEMQQLYKENNANPAGGCLPALIQMPIFFSLFAVLRNIPAYIMKVKDAYLGIVTQVHTVPGNAEILTAINDGLDKSLQIKNFDPASENLVIDLLSKLTSSDWATFSEQFSSIQDNITPYITEISHIYTFMGINLADKPVDLSNGIAGIFTIGLIIPILSLIFQFLSMKVSMSKTAASADSSQAQTQQTMMYTMPLVMVFFVFSMPAGLGVYWVVGSIIQVVQQLAINKIIHG